MPLNYLFFFGLGIIGVLIVWSVWLSRKATREMPAAGEMFDTSLGTLHALVKGEEVPKGPPPMILIHGSMTNALDMDIDLSGRFQDTRRLFIPDRPGHGFSERPQDGWRLDVQAAMIHEAASKAGISRPIVLGQSFGGAVALRYALDYPDDVAGLVLVAPVTHPWPGGVTWYNRVGLNPYYGWLFRRTFIPLYARFGAKRAVERSLRGSALTSRYHQRTRVALTFRPKTFHANNEDITRLYEQLYAQSRRYDEITIPCEALAGTHDMTVVTTVHARAMRQAMQGFKLTVIDGGGHALHHQYPEAVATAVTRLDARVAAAARSPLQGAFRRLVSVFPGSAQG